MHSSTRDGLRAGRQAPLASQPLRPCRVCWAFCGGAHRRVEALRAGGLAIPPAGGLDRLAAGARWDRG
eukprot:7332532-Lingulodinium_polyedra.AAC.1